MWLFLDVIGSPKRVKLILTPLRVRKDIYIYTKFDSWLFAICKPQQPSSNKWPWTEQLKCYILKLIVTILPKKKNHSLHQILYHACTAVDVCCVCVSFFYPMSFVRLSWTWLMCKMDILPYTAVSRKVTWIKA